VGVTDDRTEDGEIRAKREKNVRDAIVRPLFGDKQITTTRVVGDFCPHDYVTIVRGTMGEAKEVRCRSCKDQLDPLLVLEKLARSWDHATYAARENQQLAARLVELKREESNIKNRLRGTRKKIEDSRADIYFAELLGKIESAQCHGDKYEIRQWQSAYPWLTTAQNLALVEAWRLAERRFEDHDRQVSKQRKAGVRVLDGGKDA
jgi:hypothetical protein